MVRFQSGGMGLGAQVLAQAYGAELAPMEVGHFGLNIPVREIATGKIEITSQNHLYSIARDSLPHDLLVTHETSMTIVSKLFAIVTNRF